ncbi:hypothetical protein [Marinitenerispora sediminis]|uniref:Subtilisin inhibitor domain-containing protein n=1 Tax=Marinitenerispora sediminis TaxID=1931232 RepID=A0A368T6S9_9ACTN|nr:hypothetical protein [Marinitenerispora sediminis]RCV52219.1 hypothetical protein DEF28_13620 [Marinitenerispora sediminis]RCV55618.1 hypothetical protein DEF23_14045 [Marinitenerispora sediminis]RCV59210.1 hypothetical protein DEF24_10570 [Marinitenerispora sediminis]
MLKLNPRRESSGSIGTAVLGTLCFGGAVGYVAVVGASLVSLSVAGPPLEDVRSMSAMNGLPTGPIGSLRIVVDTGDEVYEQELTCTGDAATDPVVCADLARDAEQEDAADPFEEVAPGAICTETTYGGQSATVTGTWNGTRVETELNRQGSCQEARWQRLESLTDPLE